jgi:hypothetical protein
MSVDPADDFSDDIAQNWPQNTRDRRDGGYKAGGVHRFLLERARLMPGAKPARESGTAASLPGGTQIEAWPLPAGRSIMVEHGLGISPPLALIFIVLRRSIADLALIRLAVAVRESINVYVSFHCAWLSLSATLKA